MNTNNPSQSPKIISQQASQITISASTGLLPPPDILERYDKIVPGAAETIIEMAKKQSDHRIKMETLTITSREKQSARGQIFALLTTLVLSSLCAFAFFKGYSSAATIIATGTIVSTIALFLTGKKSQSNPSRNQPKEQKK